MTFLQDGYAPRPNGAATMPVPMPPPPAAGAEWTRPISNFAGTERRALSRDALAALKAEARRLVEGTTLSQHEIGKRLDVRPSLISTWKRQEGWVRPPGAPQPPPFAARAPASDGDKAETRRVRMIGRLYRVFDRQAGDLEARAARPTRAATWWPPSCARWTPACR